MTGFGVVKRLSVALFAIALGIACLSQAVRAEPKLDDGWREAPANGETGGELGEFPSHPLSPLEARAVGEIKAGAENPPTVAGMLAPVLRSQLGALDVDRVDEMLSKNSGIERPEITVRDTVNSLLRGRLPLEPKEIAASVFDYFFREVRIGVALMAKLIVVALLCAVLTSVQLGFTREGVSRLAYSACYLTIAILALTSFVVAVDGARRVITDLVSLMLSLLPMLVGLLASTGALTSAGIFHPASIAVIHGVGVLVTKLVFPLTVLSAVFESVNGLSPDLRISGLSALLRQVGLVALGICFSVFLGALVVLGTAGAIADGVTLRTTKFLSIALVPVMGKMFADAAEVVLGSSLLLKNAVGLAGALGIALMVVFPVVKLILLVFMFRLSGAAVQPLGVEGVSKLLAGMGNSLAVILLGVGTVAMMCFISIATLVSVGNRVVMLR